MILRKLLFLLLSFLFVNLSYAKTEIKNYKIGVLSLTSKKQTIEKWENTANHLSNRIKNSTFTIIPMTYDEINSAMKKTEIDFLLTNPAHYIIHEKEVKLFRLATVIYFEKGYDISSFGGVIVTLKENQEIITLRDVVNKKIAAVKRGSLGGYQAQIKEILDNDLPLPDEDNVVFTDMPHRNTLDLILEKKADVAFLRSSVIEKLIEKNEIDMNKFKIINKKELNYPYYISTLLYPEWPFSALSHIDNEIKKTVAEVLFDINQTDLSAVKGNYKGWYIPLDYTVVTDLLRELRLPPYNRISNFTFIDIVKKYTNIVISLVIISFIVLVYLIIVNIKLHKNKKILHKNAHELKKLNNNLNKSVNEKLLQIREKDEQLLEQAKMASMGEMIGNIAHQWRQPLSTISTCATGLQLQKSIDNLDDETLLKMLNKINEQSQFLSQTIDTFRDFINEDKKLTNVILQDRVNKALDIVGTAIRNSHIELINKISNIEPIYIKIKVGELSQVIMNILNNSKDALIQRNIDNPWIRVDLKTDDKNVTITIEDNAKGIEEEIIHKIFDPYFTTKHQSQGTGLGLHICYKIVTKSLKGKIWVQNTQDGAKFFIEIPLTQDK